MLTQQISSSLLVKLLAVKHSTYTKYVSKYEHNMYVQILTVRDTKTLPDPVKDINAHT